MLIMVSKFIDGFTDVIMGSLIDKTRSKMGKARPWLFWSAFPLAIFLVLLFTVPASFSDFGKYVYIFIVYTLLGGVFYTASNISYNSLISLAANDPKDRVSMGSFRFTCSIIAAMIIISATMVFVNAQGGGQRGWTIVSLLYSFIFLIFTIITVVGVKELKKNITAESDKKSETQKPDKAISFGKSLWYLGKNKYFFIILGLFIVYYIYSGIGSSVGIYYVSYILGDPALMGLIGFAGILPVVIVLPMNPKLTARFGMQKTCLIGGFISIAGSIILLFSRNKLPLLLAGSVIRSLGTGPFIGAMYALIAEIAEYAALRFNIRTEGIIYSCSSVGIKVGSGLGVAITGWLLTTGGYIGGAELQSHGALAMIQNIFLVSPLITALLMVFLLALLRVEAANKALKTTSGKEV